MSSLAAKVRCNYYLLPHREAERIRNLVRFPAEPFPLWTRALEKASRLPPLPGIPAPGATE
jgi:hypothetical protein